MITYQRSYLRYNRHINAEPFRNLFSAPIKKFYRNVTISQTMIPGERSPVYEIQLDQRKLRTPGGKAVLVPNEVLALALAREWDSQKNTIQRHCMHLTTLCNRVLDWQSELETTSILEGIMQFADTDTICFRCQEPDELVKLQRDSWDPILQWIVERYSLRPMLTNSLVSPVTMSRADRSVLTRHFLSYNRWGLIGLQACAENLKSVFLTLAAVDGFCSAARAVELSLLEQMFQIHRWGEVPSYHDVQMAEMKARVSAAIFLVLISHHQKHSKNKMNRKNFQCLASYDAE
ncbi:hypothetical protein P879_07108 [Paragonimus westermani]|uniref:ATP synthase mitochondrial F1 complex assembly factor 2 n=1 Tax=Paragonimus westermani TaxID=34504 RepID=A0A8T0DR16_9TREM|nr:hypothetical protein P879_07108 [Paragonimus westermani]